MLFRRRGSASHSPQKSPPSRSPNQRKNRAQDDTFSVKFFKWTASNQVSKLKSVTLAHILSGDTCEPLSLAEFEAYLSFREHSLENLQFVVWYQSYRARFFDLSPEQQALSPGPKSYEFKMGAPSRAALDRKAFAQCIPANSDSANPPPLTPPLNTYPSSQNHRIADCDDPQYLIVPDTPTPHAGLSTPDPLLKHNAANYTRNAPPPLKTVFSGVSADNTSSNPFSPPFPPSPSVTPLSPAIQPFREEALRIVATFLRPGAAKELALDEIVRDSVLKDLVWNTHPDVFRPAYEAIYDVMEHHSVPAFLLDASANINLPKQIFWYWVGTTDLIISVLIALSMILMIEVPPQSRRAYRLFAVPFACFGSMQFYSATRGFCTQVFGRDAVQLRPWEIQELDEEAGEYWDKVKGNDQARAGNSQVVRVGLVPAQGTATTPTTPMTEFEKPQLIPLDQLKPNVQRTTSGSTQGGTTNSGKYSMRSTTSTSPLEEWGLDGVTTLNINDPHSFTSAVDHNARPAPGTAGGPALPKLRYNWEDSWDSMGEEQSEYGRKPSIGAQPRKTLGEDVIEVRDTRNGYRRPPIFGPEKIVKDPRIIALHKAIVKEILQVGFVWTVLFTAVIMAVPSGRHSHA